MKIIAVGDPHFQVDNMPEVELFIEKLLELVQREKPNFVVVLGDVLHTHERLHTLALNKAYQFIQRLRALCPTYVLVGNHDYIQNQQFLTENHWMNGMKEWDNVFIADRVLVREEEGFVFVFCPYVPPGKFEQALNTVERKVWFEADCIFAHQEFHGCKMGAIVSAEGDHWPADYPFVLSGHIHSKQKLADNLYYCGSSMQHAFGESEENIIPVLTWIGNEKYPQIEEVDLGLPRKKIVYTDVNKVEELKLPAGPDKVKVTISGVYDDFKAFKKTKKYRQLVEAGTKVVFKMKKADKKAPDEIGDANSSEFDQILLNLVYEKKNPYLIQLYEMMLNGKNINPDDIFFPS